MSIPFDLLAGVCLGTLAALAGMVCRRLESKVETAKNCEGCGYSLEGLNSPSRCPECGRESPGDRAVTVRALYRIDPSRLGAVAACVVGTIGVAIPSPFIWELYYRAFHFRPWGAPIGEGLAHQAGLIGTRASEGRAFVAIVMLAALVPCMLLVLAPAERREAARAGIAFAASGAVGVIVGMAIQWLEGSFGWCEVPFAATAFITTIVGTVVFRPKAPVPKGH